MNGQITTEEEVARLIEPDAWALSDMEWHDDYGRTAALGRSLEERSYIRRSANVRARKIAKLYADQPKCGAWHVIQGIP